MSKGGREGTEKESGGRARANTPSSPARRGAALAEGKLRGGALSPSEAGKEGAQAQGTEVPKVVAEKIMERVLEIEALHGAERDTVAVSPISKRGATAFERAMEKKVLGHPCAHDRLDSCSDDASRERAPRAAGRKRKHESASESEHLDESGSLCDAATDTQSRENSAIQNIPPHRGAQGTRIPRLAKRRRESLGGRAASGCEPDKTI